MVTVEQLLELWHGDHLSDGYVHINLVYEICRQARPANSLRARQLFYQPYMLPEIEGDVLRVIDRGYKRWDDAGRP